MTARLPVPGDPVSTHETHEPALDPDVLRAALVALTLERGGTLDVTPAPDDPARTTVFTLDPSGTLHVSARPAARPEAGAPAQRNIYVQWYLAQDV